MANVRNIVIDGELRSRIVSGRRVSDAASLVPPGAPVYIVCDRAVEALAVSLSTEAAAAAVMAVDASERAKDMAGVLDIDRFLLSEGAGRDAFLIAVGGGVVTDMAGFAASIFKRGIGFGFVPTTLLAQVDAAVGGKNGVNLEDYKNMVGVIRQPLFTYICSEPLLTLPQREFRSGAAELIKTFIIDDSKGCYLSATSLLKLLAEGQDATAYSAELEALVFEAASVKAGIVERDQFESGERRKLNLGHTFAHAIEHVARLRGDDITHGEAVSMGLVLAASLSAACGLCRPSVKRSICTGLENAGLPVRCPYPLESLREAMLLDKKAEGKKVHFALIRDIGSVDIVDLTVDEALEKLGSL